MSETKIVIAPGTTCTRIEARSASAPRRRLLRAELPPEPSHPRAVQWLIESLALWQGSPVRAVLVAQDGCHGYVSRLYPAWFTDFGGALYTLEFHDARGDRDHRRDPARGAKR
jgi:hypothetical protein